MSAGVPLVVAANVVVPPALIAELAACVIEPPVLVTLSAPVSFTLASSIPPTESTKVTALACSIVTGPMKLFPASLKLTAAGTALFD